MMLPRRLNEVTERCCCTHLVDDDFAVLVVLGLQSVSNVHSLVRLRRIQTAMLQLALNSGDKRSPIDSTDSCASGCSRVPRKPPYLKFSLDLQRLPISLELRRLYNDLIWCYRILFGYVDVSSDEFFAPSPAVHTSQGHPCNLFKKHSNIRSRQTFFQ